MRLNDALQLLVLVPAREEQPTVQEMRQPATEDVEAGIHVDRRLNARRRIPHGRTRVIVHRVALGGVVPNRVVGQHLSVRQERNMHTHDRPVHDRAPLALVMRRPGGGSRSRAGGECRHRTRTGRPARAPAPPCARPNPPGHGRRPSPPPHAPTHPPPRTRQPATMQWPSSPPATSAPSSTWTPSD